MRQHEDNLVHQHINYSEAMYQQTKRAALFISIFTLLFPKDKVNTEIQDTK